MPGLCQSPGQSVGWRKPKCGQAPALLGKGWECLPLSLRSPEALWRLSSSHAGLPVYLEDAAVFWYLLRSQHLKVLMDLTFHSLPLNRWFLFFFSPSSFDKCPGLPMSTALPMLCRWRHPVVAIALWLLVKTFVGKGTRPSRHGASCGQLPPWTRSCWDALCSADRFFFNHWS